MHRSPGFGEMGQTAAPAASLNDGQMHEPIPHGSPTPEPAAKDAGPDAAERRPRRWPFYLIVLGLLLSLLWSGLLFWSLAGFVRWMMA
jgi:hypothetical protein